MLSAGNEIKGLFGVQVLMGYAVPMVGLFLFEFFERHAFARSRRMSVAHWFTCLRSATADFLWFVTESVLMVFMFSTENWS